MKRIFKACEIFDDSLKFVLMVSFFFFVSCTRSIDETSITKIYLPEQPKNSKVSGKTFSSILSTGWAASAPTALAEITCYAIGVEIPDGADQKTCVDKAGVASYRPNILIGPFPAGDEITVELPSGPDRTISLIGFAADSTQDCSAIVGSDGKVGPDNSKLSAPIKIGSATAFLAPGDTTVFIPISTSGALEIQSCSSWPNGGTTIPQGPPASLSLSEIVLASGTIMSGTSVSATLYVRDTSGTLISGSTNTIEFLIPPNDGVSSGSFSAVVNNGDGTYTSQLTGTIAGSTNYVSAKINGNAISQTSATFIVTPGIPSTATSILTTNRGTSATADAGQMVLVNLNFRDSYGNATTSSGLAVSFGLLGNGSSNGTFSGLSHLSSFTSSTLLATTAGTPNSIIAFINGVSVTTTVPTVQISAGPASADNSIVHVTSSTITVYGKSDLAVIPRDNYGNVIASAGLSINFNYSGVSGTLTTHGTPYNATSAAHYKVFNGVLPGTAAVTVDVDGITRSSPLPITINTVNLAVSAAYPTNGANWNKYVRWTDSSKSWYEQPDVACDGTEAGFYGQLNGCIHAGEVKKVYVPGPTTCSGLLAYDQYGWFDWECKPVAGGVLFYSHYFKKGKGLKDLIVSGSGWRSSTFTLASGTMVDTIGTSPSIAWWNNSTSAVGVNTLTLTNLNSAGTVYYVDSNLATKGFITSATQVALVTLPTFKIQYTETAASNFALNDCFIGSIADAFLICSNNTKFSWFETDVNGNAGGSFPLEGAFRINNTLYSRFHNMFLDHFSPNTGNDNAVLEFEASSDNNSVSGVTITKTGRMGALLLQSSNNSFLDFTVARNVGATALSQYLIKLAPTAENNLFDGVRVSHFLGNTSTRAVQIMGNNNVLSNWIVSNIGANGYFDSGILFKGGDGNILTQATIHNTTDAGIVIDGGLAGTTSGTLILHTTMANNTSNGIYVSGDVTNTIIENSLTMNADKGIQADPSATGSGNIMYNFNSIFNVNFATDFTSGAWSYAYGGYFNNGGQSYQGAPSTVINYNLTLGYPYAKSGPDSVNAAEDAAGIASYNSLSSNDYIQFESPYRGWGVDYSGTFPQQQERGACSSAGNCQIWDFRPASGSVVNERSVSGGSLNTAFTTGANCPPQLNGNMYLTSNMGLKFLKFAVEINRDTIGNNNGLCESGEICIYTPNIGSYQGEGAIDPTQYCNVDDLGDSLNNITNVKIYKFPTTGL